MNRPILSLKKTAAYLLGEAVWPAKKASVTILFRRSLALNPGFPIISFTFDDFPRSAFLEGARILHRFAVRGTYYASLGLIGRQGPSGPLFVREDLKALLQEGHELGSHTFDHCHSWHTCPADFERSVIENQLALNQLLPGVGFRTFAYPSSLPRPGTKRRVAKHFACCRGGFHTINAGTADLNLLRAYFLERAGGDPKLVRELIDRNRLKRGWLIFATHDICDSPSRYGCTPHFFREVVRYAMDSDARILPVIEACALLNAQPEVENMEPEERFDGKSAGHQRSSSYNESAR